MQLMFRLSVERGTSTDWRTVSWSMVGREEMWRRSGIERRSGSPRLLRTWRDTRERLATVRQVVRVEHNFVKS